ncbi:hypothetical protein AVEN_93349-1 [Araneus ventricosus]|uniref:Uncharacterized protein n=1 Tax=Araneus ventricosus TaxID=182803 RepID=A0A4Y2ECZ0_ARAVE|nr:hypothetical protein AVEN_93349-1 [Araneus ventricosus]
MAEAYAIKTALLEAQSLNDSTTPVHIFTDSMSVLKSLENLTETFTVSRDLKIQECDLGLLCFILPILKPRSEETRGLFWDGLRNFEPQMTKATLELVASTLSKHPSHNV